jgi:hypothetical protein
MQSSSAIANQLRSLRLMSIKLNSLADIQHELLALYSGQWTVPTIPLLRWHLLNLPFTVTWLCQWVTWYIGIPSANDIKPSLIATTSVKTHALSGHVRVIIKNRSRTDQQNGWHASKPLISTKYQLCNKLNINSNDPLPCRPVSYRPNALLHQRGSVYS